MKQVINVLKLKSNQEIKQISNHNLRLVDSRNVQKNRTPQNRYFVGSPTMDVIGELTNKLAPCGKYRKDANRVVDLVLSGSPEFFEDKAKTKQWEEASQKWLEDTFGKDNILYSVVHYDEKTPHFHVAIVPIHEGKLRSNYWFDGPVKMKKLHDSYNKAVKPLGLKRGSPSIKPTQTELDSYYKKVNSSTSYERGLDKKLDDLFKQFEKPTIAQRLNPMGFINEVAKPLMSQLVKNLSHYRTKAKNNENAKRENEELKSRVQDLECKLETLGIDPNTPHLVLSDLSSKIKNFVEEAPPRNTSRREEQRPDVAPISLPSKKPRI